MPSFYDYKNQKSYTELNFSCEKCDWFGTGEQAKEGMDSPSGFGFALLCPKCDKYIDWIDGTVSLNDLINYGTEEDKASAKKQMQFYDDVRNSRKDFEKNLPDIEDEEIVVILREEDAEETRRGHIVLYWGEKEIWREIRTYEYYDRYLELGGILKGKYGSRLIDFEARHTLDLGGDYFSAFEKVDNFRKSLKCCK